MAGVVGCVHMVPRIANRELRARGDDVIAVLKCEKGPLIDGTPYGVLENINAIEKYHTAALSAHKEHKRPEVTLPNF